MVNIVHIQMACDGYREACKCLRLKHIFHSPFDKRIIEKGYGIGKGRTGGFDDYYPFRKKLVDCNLIHVYQWQILFIFLYNLSKSQSKINIIKFLIRGGEEP